MLLTLCLKLDSYIDVMISCKVFPLIRNCAEIKFPKQAAETHIVQIVPLPFYLFAKLSSPILSNKKIMKNNSEFGTRSKFRRKFVECVTISEIKNKNKIL